MKDTIITVYVDTQEIIKCSTKKSEREKILPFIKICDNHYDHPSNVDFTSNIHPKTKIAWVGAAKFIMQSQEDFVIIKRIKVPNKKKSIIKIYDSKLSSGTTHVDGRIRTAKKNQEQDYSIVFLVNASGVEKTFIIDPKLRVI
jgi:hypothetical protein